MKITDVKVFPVDEDKLKAYATITFENCFIVRDLKVISGNKGYFIAMPSKKRKDGTFRDVAHPLNSDTRKMIEDAVLEVYEAEEVSSPAPVASEDTGGYGTADPAPAVEEQVEDAPPVEADVSEPEAEVENAEETGFEAEPEIAATDSTEDNTEEDSTEDNDLSSDVSDDVSDDVDRETDSDSEKDDIAKEDAPEIGESMVSAADNPTIEPVDDPEKAFGYEE
jgi:stage V sporulation protein G